ncbi:hypothetical protein [Streptomyces sp. BH104]|uniref:hypothetical protein n=1 Tax=Streptomyces sp. BH104 TaxID=3410407 RepID=UPI003BB55D88
MNTLTLEKALSAHESTIQQYAENEHQAQAGRIALWASLTTGQSPKRVIYEAVGEAQEHDQRTADEFRRVSAKLEALYAAVRAGDTSTLTRQRVERLEALQAALCGFPGQLSK